MKMKKVYLNVTESNTVINLINYLYSTFENPVEDLFGGECLESIQNKLIPDFVNTLELSDIEFHSLFGFISDAYYNTDDEYTELFNKFGSMI